MLIAMTAFIAAMGAGWQPIGGQLLASGVMLLCGHQDIRLGTRMGAGFWFFMALAFGISALVTATWAKIWWGGRNALLQGVRRAVVCGNRTTNNSGCATAGVWRGRCTASRKKAKDFTQRSGRKGGGKSEREGQFTAETERAQRKPLDRLTEWMS